MNEAEVIFVLVIELCLCGQFGEEVDGGAGGGMVEGQNIGINSEGGCRGCGESGAEGDGADAGVLAGFGDLIKDAQQRAGAVGAAGGIGGIKSEDEEQACGVVIN